MSVNFNRTLVFIILLSFVSLNAHAYHSTLLKGRVGYLNLKESIGTGSGGSTSRQKITDGPMVEIALVKFITSNIAVELNAGYSFIKAQGNAEDKKNSNMIPLNSVLQFHLPIRNRFVPYIGVGYSYNIIQNTKPSFQVKSAGGLIYQVGLDLFIFDRLGVNFDFKYAKIKHTISDSGERFKAKFKNLSTMVGVTLPL